MKKKYRINYHNRFLVRVSVRLIRRNYLIIIYNVEKDSFINGAVLTDVVMYRVDSKL